MISLIGLLLRVPSGPPVNNLLYQHPRSAATQSTKKHTEEKPTNATFECQINVNVFIYKELKVTCK